MPSSREHELGKDEAQALNVADALPGAVRLRPRSCEIAREARHD